jgi:hypothetical protein
LQRLLFALLGVFFLPIFRSPTATSAPFLRSAHLEWFPVNLPEDPVVSHSLVALIHRTFTLSGEADASVLLVPPPCAIPLFPFQRGSTLPQVPILVWS